MSVKADMEAAALRKELAEAKLDIDRIKMRLCDARTTITQFEVRAERAEKELVEAKAALTKYGDQGAFQALRDGADRAERAEEDRKMNDKRTVQLDIPHNAKERVRRQEEWKRKMADEAIIDRLQAKLVEAKATIDRLQSAPSQSDQVAVVASQLAQQASRFLEVYQQLRDEAASRPLSTE